MSLGEKLPCGEHVVHPTCVAGVCNFSLLWRALLRQLCRSAEMLHPEIDCGILMGSGSCFLFFFLPRQVHLGKDHMSFKFKKDIYEERQRVNNKYKVRITANLISFISLNILNSCYMQDVIAGGEKKILQLSWEERLITRPLLAMNRGWPYLSLETSAK